MKPTLPINVISTSLISAEETLRVPALSFSLSSLMLGIENGSEIDMKNTMDVFQMLLTPVNDYAKMLVPFD